MVVADLRSPVLGSAKASAQRDTDFASTIDMAKELAMVENNDRDREVRRYVFECERRAKAAGTMDAPSRSSRP